MTAPTPPPPVQSNNVGVSFGNIQESTGHRVVLYGTGGVGKTTLASFAPGPVAFIDLDESLPKLKNSLEEYGVVNNIMPVNNVIDFKSLRNVLQSSGWDNIKTIVIDTLTKAEELALEYIIENIPHEKGHKVKSIEDYGYGKGYRHLFDTFMGLLSDLDVHCRAGRNVILICHEHTASVPNPSGEDWIRYEPRLQNPGSGKNSIQLRSKEWADHVLFYGYDLCVKDGKGQGSGTRTLYPAELPHCMAKSRSTQNPIFVDQMSSEIWNNIIK